MVRVLIAVALLMMLLLLRLESERFAAAEYDEPVNRYHRGFWTRVDWYALGFLLLAGIYFIHPRPHDALYLVTGLQVDVLKYGSALAGVGVVQAAAFAWFRYGGLRFPAAVAYPGAAINAVGTAIIDEAAFRGVMLGMLLALGFPSVSAILVETIVYILVTRAAAPGRHPYLLFLAASFGLVGGWATIATGGIGAAIFVHAVTTFAVFVCTGHAGQVTRSGREPEEVEFMRRAPTGWREAPRTGGLLQRDEMMELFAGQGAEPLGLDDQRTRVRLAGAAPTSEPRNLELLRPVPPEPITTEPRNLFPEPDFDTEDETPADEADPEVEGAAGGDSAGEGGHEIETSAEIEVAATSGPTDAAESTVVSSPRARLSVVRAGAADASAPDGDSAAPPDAAEMPAAEAVRTPAGRLRAAARGSARAAIARFESIRRVAQSRFGAPEHAGRAASVGKPARAASEQAVAAATAAIAAPAAGSATTSKPARPVARRRSPRPNRHNSSDEATITPRPTRDRTAGWGTEEPVLPREVAAPTDPPVPKSTRNHRGR